MNALRGMLLALGIAVAAVLVAPGAVDAAQAVSYPPATTGMIVGR